MPDVWYCPDCEHRMIDCGDVYYCPVCQAHRTHAAMAVQQDVLTADDLAGLSSSDLAAWMGLSAS